MTRTKLAALSVVLLAAALRWVAWGSIGEDWWAENPTVDAWTYLQQARALLAGNDPFQDGLYQPPGLPWLMTWEHHLLGAEEASPHIPRAFNLLFGLLTTGGLVWLGERLRPWLGVVAAGFYTLYPRTLLFELDLLTPATTSLLLVVALVLYKRSWWGAALAGLALGGAVVVHPTYLVAVAVFAALLRNRNALALVVAVGLMLAPTMKRNHDAGHFALVSHNAGLNFYLGNNADWLQTAFLRPGVPFRQLALEAEPATRDQYQRNDYWMQRGWDELDWPSALLVKAFWSVNNREVPRNEDYRCRTADGPLKWIGQLPVRYMVLFPLALVGAVSLLRRREWDLPALWLALQAPMVLFLVADRYRMATLPVLVLLAAVGAERLVSAGRELDWRPWVLALGAFVVSLWPIDHVTAYQEGWCVHLEGNRLLAEGDTDGAREAYLQASKLEPDQLGHWYWLGETRARTGDPEGAIQAWDKVLEQFPDHYQSLTGAARESGRLGRFSEAADYQGGACAVPGPRTNTCARYVELLFKARRAEEARAVVRQRPELREHKKVAGLPL